MAYRLVQGALALAGVLILVAIGLIFWVAPVDGNMGIVQKIFYFHVPAAISAYLGFGLCALGSIAFLLKPAPMADRIARAGAEVGVLAATCVLITGPLWAHKSWGSFWEWEPRLTSVLLTFLIYCAYLLLRHFGGGGEMARKIGAVMGVLGMVGVALTRVSVKLWGGVHPQVITGKGGGLNPDMVPAFVVSMMGFLLLCGALIALRVSILSAQENLDALHLKKEELVFALDEGGEEVGR